MYSPAVISPRMHSTEPKTTISRICRPESTSLRLQNCASGFASSIQSPV